MKAGFEHLEEKDEEKAKIIKILMETFNGCEFHMNDEVVKTSAEEGDLHELGSRGIIKGGVGMDMGPMGFQECYLVAFEQNPNHVTFIVKSKITRVKTAGV